MPFTVVIALSILPLLMAAVCLYILRRLRSPRRNPSSTRRKSPFGFYPVAAGNALQALQEIVHPSVRHCIELQFDEQADEDDATDPNDPLQHLHRQAAWIRRGQPIDRLTARLPAPASSPASPS